jgi:hypothetical protein
MTLAPVVAEVVVPGTATEAFVGFTAQMGEWWDPSLSSDPATYTNIEIDPEGDVAMCHGKERQVWGRVTTWEPGERYVQEFWLGLPDEQRTVLDVRFLEQENGTSTRVRLEHRGWPEGSEPPEAIQAQWENLLARFAAFVS